MIFNVFNKKNLMLRRFPIEARFKELVEDVVYLNKVDPSGRIFLALGKEKKGGYVVSVHVDFKNPIAPYFETGYTPKELSISERMFLESLTFAGDAESMLEILEGYEEYAGEFFNRIPELAEMKQAFTSKEEDVIQKKIPFKNLEVAAELAFRNNCKVKVKYSEEDLSNSLLVIYGESEDSEMRYLYVTEANLYELEEVPLDDLIYRIDANKLIFPSKTAFELYREAKSDEERRMLLEVS